MSQPVSDLTWAPRPFLHWALFAYTFILGIETGAAGFVTKVVFPLWASSPEAVINWRPDSPYYLEEGDFFMYASPLTLILAVTTLIAGWKSAPPLRKWLMIATISFIVVFIVSVAYFIPIQAEVKGEAGLQFATGQLSSMLNTFVNTNYLRFLTLLVALGCALHALGISYRMRMVRNIT